MKIFFQFFFKNKIDPYLPKYYYSILRLFVRITHINDLLKTLVKNYTKEVRLDDNTNMTEIKCQTN